MLALLSFVLGVLTSPFKSKGRLEAENAALRHQLIILRRKVRGRLRPTNSDRWFLVQLYRSFPSILQVVTIMQPETIVRWHLAGFRFYWRWKSRPRGGRPQIEADLRALIRRMSIENPLWGAPRIHGELLKLGFELAQSSVEAAVAGEFDDGLGRGLHQQGVAVTLVGAQEVAELLRHGDNDMEVAGRKHLGLAVREPVFGLLGVAFGARAV